MKAVFLDYSTLGPGLDTSPLSDLIPDFEFFDATAEEQVAGRIRDAEFIIANKVRINDELMAQAPNLRFIGLTATGTDNIDLDGARTRGIAVCNIRAYCTRSVVEHVFGTLLMLTHNLHQYTAAVRAGEWQNSQVFCMHDFPVRELSSMTMGIVGYGELGRSVADQAQNFGMNVLVSNRPGSAAIADGRVSFDEILEESDVISLHCPLRDETENLFGQNEFQRMKPTSVLINTARGALVDSAALVAALESGQIGAAAIDVLSNEPPVDGDALLEYANDNLVLTPHIAWSTDRARQNAVNELAANIEAFLEGQERNRVV